MILYVNFKVKLLTVYFFIVDIALKVKFIFGHRISIADSTIEKHS